MAKMPRLELIRTKTLRTVAPGGIKIDLDVTTDVARIQLGRGKANTTREEKPGIFCDFDRRGRLLAVIVIDSVKIGMKKKKAVFDHLARKFKLPRLREVPEAIPEAVNA